LTNLLFIREKITVIEMFPFGYLDGFYYALSSYAQANYLYLIGDEIPNNPTAPHFSNLKVNINKLKQILGLKQKSSPNRASNSFCKQQTRPNSD